MPNGNGPHPSPYPKTTITELEWRLRDVERWKENIDRWRETIETEGLPKAFAILEERQRVQSEFNMEIRNWRSKTDDRLDKQEKSSDERHGFVTGVKQWVAVGAMAIMFFASLILQAVSVFTGGL